MSIRIKAFKNRWEVDIRWRDASGAKQRWRGISRLSSKSAVQKWATDRERYFVHHGKAPDQPKVPTLAEFWPRFLTGHVVANRLKASTCRDYHSYWKNHFADRFGALLLTEITTEHVQQLKASLSEQGRSSKTVNNLLSALGTILSRAVEWRVIPAVPCDCQNVKGEDAEMAYYEPADYEAVVEAAATLSLTAHLAVLLAGDAGLRAGEIRGLRWTDVNLKHNHLRVQQSDWRGHIEAPKSWTSRVVPLSSRLAAALQAHRHLRHERVLVHHGEPMSEKVLRVVVEKAIAKAGVAESARPVHRLRHTFGTRLASAAVPAKTIQELMGHKHLTTTQRYLHLSPSERDRAIRLLDGGGQSPGQQNAVKDQTRYGSTT